jgi:hypothetical protein
MSKANALARLLDTPMLARVVPHLAPETLHQLIQYRGLESSGELAIAATPAQLTSLLDLDLWPAAQPGRDEHFDADRFGEWLEVLVDAGDSVAARTVAALDQQLVILGLSRYLRVLDPGIFEPTESSDDEAANRHEMMRSETQEVLELELGGYLLRARRFDAWDAIVALLGALEGEHADCFHGLMRGCRLLSNSTPEFGGFDDPMLAPAQHLYDVAIERERRRSQRGFATAADARAFLQMARQPPDMRPTTIVANPIAAAYFRAAEEDDREAIAAPGEDIHASVNVAIELLAEAGMTLGRPRALLEAPDDDSRSPRLELLRRQLQFLQHHDQTAYLARSRELAFLANTLLAGCSIQSRPFTPQEASDAAACVCNLGIECWPASSDAFLVDHDLIVVFEAGWSVLHRDVTMFVADAVASTLADLRIGDEDTRREIMVLQRTLAKHREAATPWLARDAAGVLTILDATAWVSVIGLLDECPVLPEALTAVLDGRSTPVSPNAFEFISTTAQIDRIRAFMKMLPGVLA